MNVIFLLASFFFFLWILRNALFWVALWQLKEYRFDRIFVHLRETRQGRNLLSHPLSLLKWVVILIYPIVILNEKLLLPYQILIVLLLFPQALQFFRELTLGSFKKPVFTPKAVFIIFLTLLVLFTLFSLPIVDKFLWLLLLDRFEPFFIALLILLFSFPTEIYRDWQIRKAITKIKSFKKLLVIGVTGSYGKSSTKEFIGRVLSEKFKVLWTPGTNNTPIGIARTILTGLTEETEIFVVEMGAYKKGEISQMCEIVQPKIGVLTGISPQHLSLFGSLKNTIEAKYELIKALPKNSGLAVFNGNNPYSKKLFEKTKLPKLIYSFDNESDIKVSDIKIGKLNVTFKAKLDSLTENFKVKLLGKHNIENLLPAILIAQHLGMSFGEIKKAFEKIDYRLRTMKPIKTGNGAILVDDTFNASPDAVLSAINYMRIFKGKKILVLQPMIELGKEVKRAHYEVGLAAGKFLNKVFLTNENFAEDFKSGVRDAGGRSDLVEIALPEEIMARIKGVMGQGDVVVFEGKESVFILRRFFHV